MPARRALVVGMGIAGQSTALRLVRSGWEVVLLGRDPMSQHIGFPCAFHGIGHEAASRLGLLPAFTGLSQPRCDTVLVDATGTPFAVRPDPSAAFPVLCRNDLVAVLREVLGDVEERRHAGVLDVLQDDCGVTVTFTDGSEDWFDLVVGADGAASPVRGTAFGGGRPQRLRHTTVTGRVAGNPMGAVSMHLSGRSVDLRPLRDGGSAVLFAWRDDPACPLHDVFGDLGWMVPDLLSQLDDEPTARRTWHEVQLDHWTSGQIALVGDAAWCTSPYNDRGASLAIGGAELLGDALDIFTGTAEALRWWENQMRPVVRRARRQSAALSKREMAARSLPATTTTVT